MGDDIEALIIDGLHENHVGHDEFPTNYSYDCEKLGKAVTAFINARTLVELKDFTHGRPFEFNCTFPDCTIDGHKPPPPRRPQVHSAYGNEGYCYCGMFNCKEVWPNGRR